MPQDVLDLRKSIYFPTYRELPHDYHLRKPMFFPTYRELPHDDYHTVNDRSGTFQIKKHWCYIAEITRDDTLVSPMFFAKDKEGHESRVAFHLQEGGTGPMIRMRIETSQPDPPSFNNVPCTVGSTICIMYGHQHNFLDSTHGIRLEDRNSVSVLPCTLEKLFSLNDLLHSNTTSCNVCQKNTTQRCRKCHTLYCSRECQMAGWKQGHKNECYTLKRLREWSNFDWDTFHGYKFFN